MADEYDDSVSDSSEASASKQSKKDDLAQTALLPKSFFPHTPKPGEICKIRTLEVYEDEVSVEYVRSKDSESKPSKTENEDYS